MIFNMVGGAGGGLNFKVVDGTSAPSSPTENTIWINTSTVIPSWDFISEKPTGENHSGHVCIVAAMSANCSETDFNALKKNGIWLEPMTAWQYVSGAWVAKTAKIFQNGVWHDWWSGVLYDDGDQYIGVTGGWVQGNYQVYGSENTTGGTITIGNTIQLEDNGGQNCVSARTNKKIDLAKFTRVVATFTGNGYVFVASSTSGIPVVLGAEKANSIDISALNGEYYVGVMARNYMKMEVSKIELV